MTAAQRLVAAAKAEAKAEAWLEGYVHVLERQLTLRFGSVDAAALARLATASEADLERWTERILSAHSLEDVFE